MAEAATSSFEKSPLSLPSGLNAHSTPYLTGSKLIGQTQSLPKSYRDLLSLASVLPSIEDLNTLKSTLSSYENQLKTLKISEPKDSKNTILLSIAITDVEDSISDLKNKISTLQNAITTLKNTQFSFTEASKTLSDHQKALNTAKTNETNALTALEAATANKTVKDSVKASSKASLDSATETYNSSITQKELSDAALTQQQEAAAQALQTLNERQTQASTAAENLAQAQQTLNEASSNLAAANASKTQAQAELDAASSKLQTKQSEVSAARETYNQVTTQYNETLDVYTTVYNEYLDAQETVNITRTNLQAAQEQLNQAQSDYDTNLIPDPNYTPPTQQVEHTRQVATTTQVPHTTTQTVQSQNILPDFTTTNWTGAGTGFQGSQPSLTNGILKFSYMTQTATHTGSANIPANTALDFSIEVDNSDANRGQQDTYKIEVITYDAQGQQNGYAVYNSPTGWHTWETKTLQVIPTSDVTTYQIKLTGFDGGYWYGTYGPAMRNPQLATTTTTTTTTYEEVTTYTTETYYTTEVIQPQTGLQVRVYNQLPTANPQRSDTAYNLCKTTTLTSINHNWGGGDILGCGSEHVMIHYTGYFTPTENITYLQNSADDGFYMTLDGITVINDWRLKGCGGGWYPVTLQAGRTYALDAWFYEWGGGACSTLSYQSNNGSGVVPEAWYTNGASAPLIHDPALLPALQNAQAYYDATLLANQQAEAEWQTAQANQQVAAQNSLAAYYLLIDTATTLNALSSELDVDQNAFNQAQSTNDQAADQLANTKTLQSAAQQTFNEADAKLSTASSQLQTAAQNYNAELQKSQAAQTLNETLSSNVVSNKIILDAQQQEYNKASTELDLATSNEASLQTTHSSAQEATTEAQSKVDSSTLTQAQVQKDLAAAETLNEASFDNALGSSSRIQPLIDAANEILNKEPEQEQGSPDLPAELSADNLMDVDLNEVDPTELSEAQAEQLVEAALETFETATEGSPEYEQALDALALAAQQDDIQVSEELAAIPGVGQAAQAAVAVINAIGNLGADISPKVRKKAQTLVVTTLVVGQIAQTAALATASSGGSSNRTIRRK